MKLVDLWEVKTSEWQFVTPEKDPQIDGKVFLGKIVGQMFVPDGISGNNRFYPSDLWEELLESPDFKQRLADRLVFGMIGHEDKPITEEDLKNGMVSHIVTRMWIDEEKRGMGEALIYNTDVGRNLWMYLKGGSKLRPSTRAGGSMIEGMSHEGIPIVDKSTYTFETVDFVICPGFSQVDTRLVEKKLKGAGASKKVRGMETNGINVNELVKNLTESRDRLQKKVMDETSRTTDLSRKQAQLIGENTALKKALAGKTKALKDLVESSKAVLRDVESDSVMSERMQRELRAYRRFGKVAVLEARLKKYQDYKAFFEGLGNPKRAANIIEALVSELKRYREMGTPKELESMAESAIVQLKRYRAIGTVGEINSFLDQVKAQHQKRVSESNRREKIKKTEEFSKRLSLPVETVRTVVESMPTKKAFVVLRELSESVGTKSILAPKMGIKKPQKNLSEAFGLGGSSAALNFFRNSMCESAAK